MRNRTSRWLLVLIVLSFFLPALGSEAIAAPMNLFMGSTSSSSSAYPITVAAARVINRLVPEVRITVLETGATHDNMQRMINGKIQLCGATGYDGPSMAYHGLLQYKDKPFKKVRVFFFERETALLMAVRVDANVKTIKDLNGKRFHVGIPGSAGDFNAGILFKVAGVEPKIVYGSLADGIDMVKEGRAVGLAKYSPGLRGLDASVMEIKSQTPVRLISLTEEEVAKTIQINPGQARIEILPNNPLAKSLGLQEKVVTLEHPASHFATSDLPEEIVYKMIKAIAAGWKTDMVPSYPELAEWDLIKDTLRTASNVAKPVPLHAGVVRFFKEQGVDVPANVIPPEYKK